ncbi:MAG: NAD(P)H-hydrate dehydratase [Candidatus Methanoplasma sp.]|jgi:NAD(P)H-hydrate epimerase|nr:NAD(P)H-hydrate dehydratase [Candidatus Methanoplasma sp.]
MISPTDAAVIDVNSEALGVSVDALMDNAAAAVVNVLNNRFQGQHVAFVCGNGNNGGDGIVAASLMDPSLVSVFLLRSGMKMRSPHAENVLSSLKCDVREFSAPLLKGFDVLVDCALGTGVRGDIRSPYEEFIRSTKTFSGTIVSVDIPSGLGTNITVLPHLTVTFHDMKSGMNKDNSGEILVSDIGIPKDAYLRVGPGDMLRYPIPENNSHKGQNGRVLVIGGGAFYGAPAMTAMAALRVGADVVRIAVPSNHAPIVSSFSPVFIVEELSGDHLCPDHLGTILKLAEKHDAVVIGPGLGQAYYTAETVRDFVSRCTVPVVVDADGLTALGSDFNIDNTHAAIPGISVRIKGKVVLTPHSGEFIKLGGVFGEDRCAAVSELSEKTGAVVLLKGEDDIIADGELVKVNTTGVSAMTGAGTGDVLAGIVGGLLAKGLNGLDAAALGAYISGKAGEAAFRKHSYGLIATDIIDKIPKVLREGLER